LSNSVDIYIRITFILVYEYQYLFKYTYIAKFDETKMKIPITDQKIWIIYYIEASTFWKSVLAYLK